MSREAMTSGRQVGYGRIAAGIAVAAVAIGVAALLRRHRLLSADDKSAWARAPIGALSPPYGAEKPATVTAARNLNRAAALLDPEPPCRHLLRQEVDQGRAVVPAVETGEEEPPQAVVHPDRPAALAEEQASSGGIGAGERARERSFAHPRRQARRAYVEVD